MDAKRSITIVQNAMSVCSWQGAPMSPADAATTTSTEEQTKPPGQYGHASISPQVRTFIALITII